MKFSLRLLYLYLFSFVGLIITVIGTVQVVNLGIKTYVFRVSDYPVYSEPIKMDGQPTMSQEEVGRRNTEEQKNQRQREVSNSMAMILVGVPVHLYH